MYIERTQLTALEYDWNNTNLKPEVTYPNLSGHANPPILPCVALENSLSVGKW
jgi:hypothetical protein